MKLLLMVIVTAIISRNMEQPTLHDLRRLFLQAGTQKDAAQKMQGLLTGVDTMAAPVMLGYRGASDMMQAKYAVNPLTKMKKFNEGRTWITNALNRDSMNLEVRFLRFTVQCNAPALLGYHDQVQIDKQFLMKYTATNADAELKGMIINYLTTSAVCTEDELKKLRN
jgi:hypothetical protein